MFKTFVDYVGGSAFGWLVTDSYVVFTVVVDGSLLHLKSGKGHYTLTLHNS